MYILYVYMGVVDVQVFYQILRKNIYVINQVVE